MMSTPDAPTPTAQSRKAPTLEAIALEASVSTSTVSKVLNGRKGIATETRDRVWRSLLEHGYQKPGTHVDYAPHIELIFGSLDGEWTIELIRGASAVARANGLTLTVSESGVQHGVAPGWAQAVAKRQPCGVVLVSSTLSSTDKAELRSRNVPFVIVDPAGSSAPDVPSVGSTNWAGGVAATNHLIELGHTRIGVIAGRESLMATRARLSGFRSAMEASQLPIEEGLVYLDELPHEASPIGALQLLDRREPATAIFATSDVKALGVYEAARSLGLSVPSDVSVVGYDDLGFARWAGPPLTTIRQRLSEMAMEAARMILSFRNDPQTTTSRIELATSLVVRESTMRVAASH